MSVPPSHPPNDSKGAKVLEDPIGDLNKIAQDLVDDLQSTIDSEMEHKLSMLLASKGLRECSMEMQVAYFSVLRSLFAANFAFEHGMYQGAQLCISSKKLVEAGLGRTKKGHL